MAQWLGGYSGQTHATKVADAEQSLRHAIDVFRSASSDEERKKKAKTVLRLSKRVMTVRLKLLGARLAEAQDVQSGEALARRAKEIAYLEHREASLREQGLDCILGEFGVTDLSTT